MSLAKKVRSDEKFKTFKTVVERTRERMNFEKDAAEAATLHASRSSRSLYGKQKYSPKALLEASMQDLANRSRLVEIRAQMDKQLSYLEEATKNIKRYISTQYNSELSEYGTVNNKQAMVDRIVNSAIETLSEGQSVLNMVDLFIKDIDQAGYAIKNCVAILQLLDSSKTGSTL